VYVIVLSLISQDAEPQTQEVDFIYTMEYHLERISKAVNTLRISQSRINALHALIDLPMMSLTMPMV
jgi:hypothetical protein